jgi:hypothetical protein
MVVIQFDDLPTKLTDETIRIQNRSKRIAIAYEMAASADEWQPKIPAPVQHPQPQSITDF